MNRDQAVHPIQRFSQQVNPPVSNKTLKNRRKRMRQKANRAARGLPRNRKPKNRFPNPGGGSEVAPMAVRSFAGGRIVPGSQGGIKGTVGGFNSSRDTAAGQSYKSAFGMKTCALSDQAESFCLRHLDPNGEYRTDVTSLRIPDGAIPQSAGIRFAQGFNVKPPGQLTTNIPLDGSTWSLLVWNIPTFRYPGIFIAVEGEAEPSSNEMFEFTQAFNNFQFDEELDVGFYPNWVAVANTNLFFCVMRITALADVTPPTETGFSKVLQQFRFTGEGITIYNNTPTLIDQGMIVGAQWNSNYATENVAVEVDGDGFIPGKMQVFWSIPASPGSVLNATFSLPGLVHPIVGVGLGFIANGNIPMNNNLYITLESGASLPVPGGSNIVWNQTPTTLNFTYGATTIVSLPLTQGLPSVKNLEVRLQLEGEHDVELSGRINVCSLPAYTSQDMIQGTPRTVVLTMKEDNGGYVCKRVFQPIFNMQDVSGFAPIRFNHSRMTKKDLNGAIGNLSDTFDRNFATSTVILLGIPTSCNPFLLYQRYVEVVANPGSDWMMFMGECPAKDPIFDTFVRTFVEEQPLMYPESFNSFSKLFDLVLGALEELPVINATVPAIGSIIRDVLGGAFTTKNGRRGGTRNRITDLGDETNIDMIEKLLGAIRSMKV